ncbi:MAG: hypothetical protein SFW67_25735 [Myxococcaceae bacterium]|nr:hypothetical protein [Myxococcaceae bacterium]
MRRALLPSKSSSPSVRPKPCSRLRTGMRLTVMMACLAAGSGLAWGPVVEGGAMVVGVPLGQSNRSFTGTTASLGMEIGDRFNHELALEWVSLVGNDGPARSNALGGRYTFSVDFLGKKGFTPTVGIGLSVGRFIAQSPGDSVGGFFLAGRGLAGVRYTFDFGLSLKALVAVNFYGVQLSVAPTLGVAWRF